MTGARGGRAPVGLHRQFESVEHDQRQQVVDELFHVSLQIARRSWRTYKGAARLAGCKRNCGSGTTGASRHVRCAGGSDTLLDRLLRCKLLLDSTLVLWNYAKKIVGSYRCGPAK